MIEIIRGLVRQEFMIFFMMGLIFLCIGLFAFISPYYRKRVCTKITTAKVVDIVKARNRGSKMRRTSYYPVFNYDASGENITIKHNVSPSPYKIGDTFTLFYDPLKPSKYYIEGRAGGNWVMILIGAIFTPIGIITLIAIIKLFILPYIKTEM